MHYEFPNITTNNGVYKHTNGTYELIKILPSETKINDKYVTNIGQSAFKESKYTKVIIPDTIVKIDSGAFFGCKSL